VLIAHLWDFRVTHGNFIEKFPEMRHALLSLIKAIWNVIMKKFILGLIASLSATAAAAGTMVYEAPATVEMAEPMQNGSGAWLIPLAIIAILALTLTGEDTTTVPSDSRLKANIIPVGTAPNGLPLYTYNYIGGSQTYLGVMAQDVLMHTPEAVVMGPFGFMMVDYGLLGMEMQPVN